MSCENLFLLQTCSVTELEKNPLSACQAENGTPFEALLKLSREKI